MKIFFSFFVLVLLAFADARAQVTGGGGGGDKPSDALQRLPRPNPYRCAPGARLYDTTGGKGPRLPVEKVCLDGRFVDPAPETKRGQWFPRVICQNGTRFYDPYFEAGPGESRWLVCRGSRWLRLDESGRVLPGQGEDECRNGTEYYGPSEMDATPRWHSCEGGRFVPRPAVSPESIVRSL